MSANPRWQRLLMWLLAPFTWQPPTLAIMNRRATLRWVWSGCMEDAKKVGPDILDGLREGATRARAARIDAPQNDQRPDRR